MKSKANQIYLKQAKIIQDVMSIHYQKFNCKKIICVTTIVGGLMCFHPSVFSSHAPFHHPLHYFLLVVLTMQIKKMKILLCL